MCATLTTYNVTHIYVFSIARIKKIKKTLTDITLLHLHSGGPTQSFVDLLRTLLVLWSWGFGPGEIESGKS